MIRRGLNLGQEYMDIFLGGGTTQESRRQITVKIVATGEGDEFGNCCGSSHQGVARPFFDIALLGWPSTPEVSILNVVVHEYTHAWQFVDCRDFFGQNKIWWLTEGIATFVGFQTMFYNGHLERRAMLEASSRSPAAAIPLEQLEEQGASPHPGAVGYIAVDRLVTQAPEGQLAIRRVCEFVAGGSSIPNAFNSAFGISLAEFYESFDPIDVDNDGITLTKDNCPATSNADQTNTDNDREGNACDADDDNDGLSDDQELARGRNPLVNEGAVGAIINSILAE